MNSEYQTPPIQTLILVRFVVALTDTSAPGLAFLTSVPIRLFAQGAILTLRMLHCWVIFMLFLFFKKHKVSNSLDPDQDRYSVCKGCQQTKKAVATEEGLLFYSKTCVKWPISKRSKNWFLRPIIPYCRSKVLQNAPKGAFCNTFNLH